MKKVFKIILPVLALAITALLVTSCKDSKPKTDYYYDFDEVDYYFVNKDFTDLIAIDSKKHKTLKDSLTFKIMTDFYQAIPDDLVVPYLDSIGYTRKTLAISKHTTIRQIFSRKPSIMEGAVACEPIYRDIYVFRKNGQVSGVAKLCYQCGISSFLGTKVNTNNFGNDGEFQKLKQLLKE